MTDERYPHTEKEWERYKAELEAEGLEFFFKGFIIAMVVVLIVVLGWFFWMMWISTGGSY